jgi:hypothetical protein
MMARETLRVIGRSTLNDEHHKDEPDAQCAHCGRNIRRLAHMSNGQIWGEGCAAKRFTVTKVRGAPVVRTVAELRRANCWTGNVIAPGGDVVEVRARNTGTQNAGKWVFEALVADAVVGRFTYVANNEVAWL